MTTPLPQHTIKPVPDYWLDSDFADWPWQKIAPLPPLTLADGSAPADQQTTVRLCCSEDALYVRFECDDRDIWWTHENHNDAIYDEEVVEVFIGAGTETPTTYYELEISPGGVAFWARVHSPHGDRTDLQIELLDVDSCALNWVVDRHEDENRWIATIEIPWEEITSDPTGDLPKQWRANFYRIERPRDPATGEQTPEFSCWSPTLTEPADFHRAGRFGILSLK